MNSGRVRIYELSKELNLENKDLLAICEELSILVKSHSSTITDAEAEQIRTAAQQYHPASHSSPKSTSARQGASSHMADSKTKPPAPVTKKPQILEIRTIKPEIRPSTPQPPVPPSSHSMASSPTPPASTPQPPAKPVPPPRSAQTTPSPDLASQVEPPSESVPLPEPPAASPIAVALSPDSSESEPVAVEPAPSLASPPPRPGASSVAAPPAAPPPAAASAQRRSNLPNRPVLKQAQSGGGTPKSAPSPSAAGDQSGSPSAKPTRPIIVNKQSAAGSSKQPDAAASAARPQQIVELRRPRPVRSEPEVTPSARIDRPDEGIGAVPELLAPPILRGARVDGEGVRLNDRPTLPKTGVKRGKGWEEEEEVVEFPAKSAKSPAKGKRRGPDLDEDEDDLDVLLDLEDDEEGEDADAPTQVTLSLVRPPKPKGTAKPSQSKPVTAAAPRSKKSSSSSSRDRRDRREEAKVEKPAVIRLTGGITIQELSAMLTIPDTDIIRALFMKGIAATVTQTLDIETATMVAKEFDVEVETGEKESEARKIEMLDLADMDNLQRRPPVVTIMGHVDHGKTTLLDSIRKTKVAQGEAGGITQHIGAYHVDMEHNGEMQQVVFLDTPGHEAFTAMRARGARVTDIAILVVAADDGVRPQTVEAISHAKAAGVPIIVAINKIDKEEAQPERVKQELTEYALVSEDWGGETIMVPVSAMTGQNLDSLLEMILLVAEIEDLHANPDRLAKGTVIEAHLDKAKGAVATLLVQNGTLRVGDTLVAGSALGKVRAMVDDLGHQVQVASPSFAVEVLGLRDVPAAGDEFEVFADAKTGGAVAQARLEEQRRARLLASVKSTQVSLNTLSARAQEGKLKELNLVLKADVQGSVEAILGSLKQLPQGEVQVRVLFAAPGEISETDVDLAAASSAVIIGFNTTLAPGARQAADRAGVDVRDYDIIYNLLDDIRAAMEGLLEPELVEEHLGQVEVRAVFPVGRGSVAGCYVQSGKIVRNAKMRVRRGSPNGPVVFEGGLDSLKRMKEDAKEVNFGYECGIGSDDFNGWEISDSIEVYKMITKRRTLASK